MGRLTNRKIIDELLPILKEKETENPELDEISYYDHPCHEERIASDITVRWTGYGDGYIKLEVTKHIPHGKYDHATLNVNICADADVETVGYAKEYRGMGNGFYATVDRQGNILHSEWD